MRKGMDMKLECVVNGPIETNTYFVIAGNEALVIDPAWEGEKLARDFAERHPDVRIVGIACTHGHADHVGGVAGMRRVLGEDCPFMLPAADQDTVEANIEQQRQWGIATEHPGTPTRLLRDGDTVGVGDVTFTVIATPGHTPGGVVFYAEHPNADERPERASSAAEGQPGQASSTAGDQPGAPAPRGADDAAPVAFVGDTLFPGSHGRTDLAGGDEQAILASLAKLGRMLSPATRCYIGHGPATTIAQELATNPFMR